VPDGLRGRVNAINSLGVFGGIVAGSAIGGPIASQFGITAPFWFAFVGSAVFVVGMWRQLTHIAHADDEPSGPTTESGGTKEAEAAEPSEPLNP
jgi:predicted MFS family arabinose efflux permease